MTKKQREMTAAELMAQLDADPEFVAAREKREAARIARVEALRLELHLLLEELRRVECPISDVWDLTSAPYPMAAPWPQALPVLLEHLANRTYSADARRVIAYTVAVPEVKAAGWNVLLQQYRTETAQGPKEALATALTAASDDEVLPVIVDLLQDARHGSSRLLLLGALAKSNDPNGRKTLKKLSSDPELGKESRKLLRSCYRKKQ